MKPQQQDSAAKKESAVYVQTPEGKQVNVETDQPLPQNGGSEAGRQTAENVPTQSSSEVTSGEAG